jgi:hypothetical protein
LSFDDHRIRALGRGLLFEVIAAKLQQLIGRLAGRHLIDGAVKRSHLAVLFRFRRAQRLNDFHIRRRQRASRQQESHGRPKKQSSIFHDSSFHLPTLQQNQRLAHQPLV